MKGIEELANVPSREELLGRLFGSWKSPVSNFARVIAQIAEKGPDAGEAAAPAEEAKAEEAAPAEAPAEEAAPAEAEAPAAEEAKAEE